MKGNKRDLTEEDFFKIDEQELCDPLMKRLEHYWNPVAKKYQRFSILIKEKSFRYFKN